MVSAVPSRPLQASARTLAPGTRLGHYVLGPRIGRGGMAELYLARTARPQGFSKLVALKLVLPHLTDEPRFTQMLLTEARLAATLDHPNIVQVMDLGVADGEYFIAMEYVHGEDVRTLLQIAAQRHMPLPLGGAIEIVRRACAGLHYAHETSATDGGPRNLVHRDVSPSNVIVRYDGQVKLVDFGIAKAADVSDATRTGVLKGKVGYLSPEQCRGEAIDRRTDVFGLGILLYEVTTGRRLFFGDNEFAVMNRIGSGIFERPTEIAPGYPPQLEAIVLRALANDPALRYPSARALESALDEFVRFFRIDASSAVLAAVMRNAFGDRPYPATERLMPTTEITVPSLRTGKRRSASAAGRMVAVVGLGALLGGLGFWVGSRQARSAAEPSPPPVVASPDVVGPGVVGPPSTAGAPAGIGTAAASPTAPADAQRALADAENSVVEPSAPVAPSRARPPKSKRPSKRSKPKRPASKGSKRRKKPEAKKAPALRGTNSDSLFPRPAGPRNRG